ncbi:MAG TPA: hypothetical protein VII43_09010, partial [Opitutaceae bacterium]
ALALGLAACLVLFGAAVKLYTGHVWEDFLITFRFSENLVLGRGLVYQPGERVFGFTSPLDAVLPALFKAVLGGPEYFRALWAFALVSLSVLGAGIVAYSGLLRDELRERARAEVVALSVLCALNVKLVMNAINGQEAGLWGGFLLMAYCALLRPGAGWKGLGLAAGGLLWTRPDSPVQIALLALGALLFSAEPRRDLAIRMSKAATLCAVVYLPWFAWTTIYYGSPLPHTITAKINMFGGVPGLLPKMEAFARILPQALAQGFEPIYSEAGGWPQWVNGFGLVAGVVCSLYWLIPSSDRIGRVASLVYLGSAAYLGCVGVSGLIFPWYYIPCVISGGIVLSRIIGRGLGTALGRKPALAALAILVTGLGYESVFSMIQLKIRQVMVEDGTRKQIGLWLHDHMKPGDTVYLEPIGYIGYYSQAHILDYPGLVSPSVVRARHETGQGFYGCIGVLKPDWVVARPGNLQAFQQIPELHTHYAYAWSYDAGVRTDAYRSLPGSGFLEADSHLIILRRIPGTPAPAKAN